MLSHAVTGLLADNARRQTQLMCLLEYPTANHLTSLPVRKLAFMDIKIDRQLQSSFS